MNATHFSYQQNMSAFCVFSSISFQAEYNSSSDLTSEVYTWEFFSWFFLQVTSEPRIAIIYLLCLLEDLERVRIKTSFLKDPEQL